MEASAAGERGEPSPLEMRPSKGFWPGRSGRREALSTVLRAGRQGAAEPSGDRARGALWTGRILVSMWWSAWPGGRTQHSLQDSLAACVGPGLLLRDSTPRPGQGPPNSPREKAGRASPGLWWGRVHCAPGGRSHGQDRLAGVFQGQPGGRHTPRPEGGQSQRNKNH